MKRLGKKALAWIVERKQWFLDHPQDYYNCHYCLASMDAQNTTLDHTNNRNHTGTLVACCYWDNSRKGSISHDRYVARYYPNHKCEEIQNVE